jgi:RND family efflux transporter MFP subunit
MSRAERWCGALLLSLGLVGCGADAPPVGTGAGAKGEAAPVAGEAELVSSAWVRTGEIRNVISTSGSIVARRSTPIGPAVEGRIIDIFVDVGDEVAFAAPLFQIDPGPYANALQAAEAGLALASAQLEQAREESERVRKLAAKQMISEQEHRRARTRLSVAAAQVQEAEARVANARDDLRRTLVLAPYAGSIVERHAHEGVMGTVRPSTNVVTLLESGALEAVLDVPEAAQPAVRQGDAVRLFLEGLPDPIESSVRAVTGQIDRRTRTYEVRVPVDQPDGTVKAGAFVRAEIEPRARQGALLVERSAIVRSEGAVFVFRILDGVAERVPVRVGIVGAREVEVLDGLAEGDEVVVGEVVARLTPGTPVRPIGEPAPGARAASAGEEGARP